MRKISFCNGKLALEAACKALRSFTLARHGFTQKDGIAGIKRVTEQCDRMEKLFSDGTNARESRTIVAWARPQVRAAKARLDLLQGV